MPSVTDPIVHPAIDAAILLRVRAHIIEYLELAASFDQQRAYQRTAPELNVPNEILHQWGDWVAEDWAQRYTAPVFSEHERVAMADYQRMLDSLIEKAPATAPTLEQLFDQPAWQALRSKAAEVLAVFMQRGKLPEQAEAP
ncbi:MAG: hypothetical protein V4488_17390 [Pseudomonadota bacterium]